VVTSAVPRNAWVRETTTFSFAGYTYPTATLSLSGSNDGVNKSSFFVDDVTLVRQCAGALGEAVQEEALAEGLPAEATPDPMLAPMSVMTTPVPPVGTPFAYLPVVANDVTPDDKDPSLLATCTNVLANGGFEDTASAVWTGVANTGATIYNVLPNGAPSGVADPLVYTTRPRSGARSGRVGAPGVNGYWNELLQTVQLPSNVISLTLTYWRYLDTQETSTTTAYDVFKVGLETEKGIQIATPQQIDNRSAGRGQWVQETLAVSNAVAYSNQKLWVTFKGTLDNNLPTALYVDDVALEACVLR
jgi:hypothetical protein